MPRIEIQVLRERESAALLYCRDKIVGQAAENFSRDLGRNDLAKLTGLFAVTAERDVTAAANHQFVVTRAVVALLRWAGAELNGAAVGIGLNQANWFQQVCQLLGKRLADRFELFEGGVCQLVRRIPERLESAADSVN